MLSVPFGLKPFVVLVVKRLVQRLLFAFEEFTLVARAYLSTCRGRWWSLACGSTRAGSLGEPAVEPIAMHSSQSSTWVYVGGWEDRGGGADKILVPDFALRTTEMVVKHVDINEKWTLGGGSQRLSP